MATDTGLVTQGTDFRISDDDVTYVSFGCVESWDLSTAGRNEIDTTCLLDTSKTFKFGLKDNGTVTCEMFYAPDGAGQVLLEASYASSTPYYFEIEYSDNAGTTGTIKSFQGYVTNYSQNGAKDDVVKQSVSIKLSGDVTTAAPTPI